MKYIIFLLLPLICFGQNTFGPELLNNPNFDANITGWVANGTPTTLEWAASGGGFTGTAHCIGDGVNDGIVQTGVTLIADSTYRFAYKYYQGTTAQIRASVLLSSHWGATLYNTIGVHSDTTTFTVTSGGAALVWIYCTAAAASENYIDFISLKMVLPDTVTAPTGFSPSNGATGVSITPTLSWSAVTYADSYFVSLSENSDLNSALYDTTIAGTSLQTSLSYNTKYYWLVGAKNAYDTTFADTLNFTTVALQTATQTGQFKKFTKHSGYKGW